jgi:predicted dinucleotide-utilizing enzyme
MNLRVGLVGCGWISTYQIEGWRLIPDVEVVAVCDLEAARAHRLASQYGIPWSGDDAARMMDKCKLDILDIATPPRSHKDLALPAVERGIHMVCQKPSALTLADREMICCADVVNCIMAVMKVNPAGLSRIELPEPLTVGLEAYLGELQSGEGEKFVPLVIKRVFSVSRLKDSAHPPS